MNNNSTSFVRSHLYLAPSPRAGRAAGRREAGRERALSLVVVPPPRLAEQARGDRRLLLLLLRRPAD